MHAASGDRQTAIALLDRVRAIAERSGSLKVLAAEGNSRAKLLTALGDHDGAVPHAQRAIEARKQLQDVQGELNVWATLIAIRFGQGRYDVAIELGEPQLERASQLGLNDCAVAIGTNVGLSYEWQGDLDRAVQLYTQAAAVAERAGDLFGVAQLRGNLANVETRRGNADAAELAYRESQQAFEQLGDVAGQIRSFANLANVAHARGERDAAFEANAHALALADAHGFERMTGLIHLNQGSFLWHAQRLEEAGPAFVKAFEVLQAAGDATQAGQAALWLAFVQGQLGDGEGAWHAATTAIEVWREHGIEHPAMHQALDLLRQLREHGFGEDAPEGPQAS